VLSCDGVLRAYLVKNDRVEIHVDPGDSAKLSLKLGILTEQRIYLDVMLCVTREKHGFVDRRGRIEVANLLSLQLRMRVHLFIH